ncbi:MAG: hypothetical protein GY950_27960 [bacterium]|nr:hypothetical protein [bacterium]
MRKVILITTASAIIFTLFASVLHPVDGQTHNLSGPYLGQVPPGDTPRLFAPGIVSTGKQEHSAPAFTPDGREVFWSLHTPPFGRGIPSVLMHMKISNGKWAGPVKASFSGEHGDDSPILAPDGKTLYFGSKRPTTPDGKAKKKFDLWKVSKQGEQWGKPVHMGGVLETASHDIAASQTTSGVLYFLRGVGGKDDPFTMLSSKKEKGRYTKPVKLPAPINTGSISWTPYISPDESFILFSSERPDGYGSLDLYVCFRRGDGSWGKAYNLGPKINTKSSERFPAISPDGKRIFFVSNRMKKELEKKDVPQNGFSDIYWVDAGIIQALKQKHAAHAPY